MSGLWPGTGLPVPGAESGDWENNLLPRVAADTDVDKAARRSVKYFIVVDKRRRE